MTVSLRRRPTAFYPFAWEKLGRRTGTDDLERPYLMSDTERDLREKERMLTTLLANFGGMVYRCRDDAFWTMEFVSEGCIELTGYRPEELLFNSRLSYEEVTHPEDRQWVRNYIRAAVDSRQRFDMEYRIIRADGSLCWVWERGVGVYGERGQVLALEGFVQDITERKRAEQDMAEAERRYRGIFENAIEGIFQTTLEGRYITVNPALARIYGYTSPEDMMSSLNDIQHQLYVDPRRRSEFLRLMRERDVVTHFESPVYHKSGEIIWISENARAVRAPDGTLLFFEGTVEDISERKRYREHLEFQASHDLLTGLPNRALLRDRLEQAIHHARQCQGCLAVAFIDLDRFKFINDSLGHQVGDQFLQFIAQRLKACLREGDTVARQGGDEFVILLTQQASRDSVETILRRLLAQISTPWRFGTAEFHVTCSIGVSLFPDDGGDADSLLKNADSAMYQAKQLGRDRVRFFTSELSVQLRERLDMEHKLRVALDQHQFALYYQPRIDLRNGQLLGAELLLRWHSPDDGVVTPGRFIPLAEETGLILPIGAWVIREACQHIRRWQDLGGEALIFSVNISPRQFQDRELWRYIHDTVLHTGINPRSLELELTENLVMSDAEHGVAVLTKLKQLGIQVAIDDFGTGYSSLSYLKKFPVDRLKIDKSFVGDLAEDAEDASIVRAIIKLGHSLNLKVVAEGVETKAQADFLRRQRCDEGQGYYYARPMPKDEFEALLVTTGPG